MVEHHPTKLRTRAKFNFVVLALCVLLSCPIKASEQDCGHIIAMFDRAVESRKIQVGPPEIPVEDMHTALCALANAQANARKAQHEYSYRLSLAVNSIDSRPIDWSPRTAILLLDFNDIYFVERAREPRGIMGKPITFRFMPEGPGPAHEVFNVEVIRYAAEGQLYEVAIEHTRAGPF